MPVLDGDRVAGEVVHRLGDPRLSQPGRRHLGQALVDGRAAFQGRHRLAKCPVRRSQVLRLGPLAGQEEQLVVNIAKTGQIFLNDTAMTPEQLGTKLRAIAAARPDRQLYVRADQAVPYGQVMRVMGTVHDAGLVRVGLVTEPPPERRR